MSIEDAIEMGIQKINELRDEIESLQMTVTNWRETCQEQQVTNTALVEALKNAEKSFLSLAPFLPSDDDRAFATNSASHCRDAYELAKG